MFVIIYWMARVGDIEGKDRKSIARIGPARPKGGVEVSLPQFLYPDSDLLHQALTPTPLPTPSSHCEIQFHQQFYKVKFLLPSIFNSPPTPPSHPLLNSTGCSLCRESVTSLSELRCELHPFPPLCHRLRPYNKATQEISKISSLTHRMGAADQDRAGLVLKKTKNKMHNS